MYSRMVFCLFILCFLIELEWFGKIKQFRQMNHDKAFRRLVFCLIIATLAKIAKYTSVLFLSEEVAMVVTNIGFCFFYIAITFVCLYFAQICYIVVKIDTALSKKKKWIWNIPAVAIMLLFLPDPILHHIVMMESVDFATVTPLFYLQWLVMLLYCTPAFIQVFRHSKYLPSTFVSSILILIFLWLASLVTMIFAKNDDVILASFLVGITLVMFALLSYSKFLNPDMCLLNKKALYTYLDRCVDKKLGSTIYLVHILGYQYLDDFYDVNHSQNVLMEVRSRLQEISPVQNMYYVGNGRMIIVIDDKEKVDENAFQNSIKEACEREQISDGIRYSINTDIYILKMPEDLKSVDQLKQYLRFHEQTSQIRDMEEPVHIYRDEQLNVQKAIRVRKVEEAIQRAITQKSFQVNYQPIYSIEQDNIHSAEALVRLKDPEMGDISPDEFIPIAEKNGMIVDVGLQVFESVCQFLHNASLAELGMEYIEVNLSMEQFMDDLLCYKLQSIMDKYEIPKSLLNLEITETATMYEEVKLRRQMSFMSEKGFRFSLDDYGSGYSNLESVIEYPLELVKLDKTIVWSAEHNPKSYATMQSLIQLFHNLGMHIVAEGVETIEQLSMLKKMECDYIQGYYYSKPLCKEDFLEYIKNFNK